MDDKPPFKWAWSVSRDLFFSFNVRNHIFGSAEARVAKLCMQVEYIDDRLPSNGRGQGHATRFYPHDAS